MSQRGEDPPRCPAVGSHGPSHDGHQRQIAFYFHVIRLYRPLDARQHVLLVLLKLILVNDHAHGIDTRRHMLKGDAVLFEDLQHLAAEADLGVHHVFLYVDRHEAFLARDAGDGIIRAVAGAGHDHRPFVLRTVGVADVDGDARLAHREDGVLMQYGRSHIGKFPQLPIGDDADHRRIFDDPGIRNQEPGHVRPVLVQIRAHRFRHDGASDIGTASGKGLDTAVGKSPVKSGDHRRRHLLQARGQHLICLVRVKFALFVEADHLRRIDERVVQICGHDPAVQVLPSGRRIIAACLFRKVLRDDLEFILQGKLQVQPADDLIVPGLDLPQHPFKIFAVGRGIIALVQHVRHFYILGETFARRGRHHITSVLIRADDISHFAELLRAGQGTSSEFHHFFHSSISSFFSGGHLFLPHGSSARSFPFINKSLMIISGIFQEDNSFFLDKGG